MLLQIFGKYQYGQDVYSGIQQKVFSKEINTEVPLNTNPNPIASTMRDINSDYIAWINIKGTSINYPIVSESSDIDYLTHDFYKNKNFYGCLFVSQINPFKCGNTIIYGHNMKNGAMFGSLKKYLDQSYFNNHRNISIYYNNYVINYYVFSVQITNANSSAYEYDVSSNYFKNIKDASIISPIDFQPNETTDIITLSTCYQTSSRLLIQAYKRKDNL